MILNGLKHLEELVNEQSGGNSFGGGGGGAKPSKFPTKPSNFLKFVNFS